MAKSQRNTLERSGYDKIIGVNIGTTIKSKQERKPGSQPKMLRMPNFKLSQTGSVILLRVRWFSSETVRRNAGVRKRDGILPFVGTRVRSPLKYFVESKNCAYQKPCTECFIIRVSIQIV